MKILHTSDWHLGKYLDRYSRIEEQEQFIEELDKICEAEDIDLIIIAGDIFDTANPPVIAEKLFFSAIKKLSLGGKRPIVIIAGNHDSPNKLTSSKPLAYEYGIILQGTLNSIAEIGDYEGFKITKSGEGFFEIEIKGEKAVFLTMPYPTEKTINEIIFKEKEEEQKDFSDKIKEIFFDLQDNFKEDTINIIVSHLFVKGGIETDSERKIQTIGGTYAVDPSVFPKNTDYVALGHLHRMQKVKNSDCMAYYSGSPIRYSQSEIGYEKCVLVLDMGVSKETQLKKIVLTDYKPIQVLKCKSYEDAFDKCNEISKLDCFTFIEIISKRVLSGEEIRILREIKKDIVSIVVKLKEDEELTVQIEEEVSILAQFKQFYFDRNGIKPKAELLDTFLEILNEIENEGCV